MNNYSCCPTQAISSFNSVCTYLYRAVSAGWPGVSWLCADVLQLGLTALAGTESRYQETEVW